MKICRFKDSHNRDHFGIIEDNLITKAHGTPFGQFTKTDTTYRIDNI
nr:DUF2437 domain-containing protein [Candidatus Dadabacteria bacterium]